jgi:hypothetical protein
MERSRRVAFVGLLCIAAASTAQAQKKAWWLEPRAYYNPILADPRAAQTNAGVPMWGDRLPFMATPGRSMMWDIDVGAELPVIGFETANSATSANGVATGQFGHGLWIAIDFHLLESLTDSSMPVLNTDYRFSLLWKAQRGIAEKCWLSLIDCRLGARMQVGHESTHLGDEYTITASQSAGFERVNISYEYWDLALSFDGVKPADAWRKLSSTDDNFTFRLGVIGLIRPGVGYYGSDALFPPATTFTRSHNYLEPYAQTQFIKEGNCHWWFKKRESLGCYLSIDWRAKTLLQYHRASADLKEPMIGSVNITMGYRPQASARVAKLNPYLRFYHGVNPHGQFRSMAGWTEFGFGLHVDR